MTFIKVYFLFGDNQGQKAHDKYLVKHFVMFKKMFQEKKNYANKMRGKIFLMTIYI